MGSPSGKVSAPRSRSQHLEEPLRLGQARRGARRGGGDDLRLVSRAVNPSCNWDLSLPNWLQESETPRLPRRGAGTGDVPCGDAVLFLFIFPFLASFRLETAPERRMPDPSAAPASSKCVYQEFFSAFPNALSFTTCRTTRAWRVPRRTSSKYKQNVGLPCPGALSPEFSAFSPKHSGSMALHGVNAGAESLAWMLMPADLGAFK